MREPKCATRWAALLVTQPGTGDWEQLRLLDSGGPESFGLYARLRQQLASRSLADIGVRGERPHPFQWDHVASNDFAFEDAMRIVTEAIRLIRTSAGANGVTATRGLGTALGMVKYLLNSPFVAGLQACPQLPHWLKTERLLHLKKETETTYVRSFADGYYAENHPLDRDPLPSLAIRLWLAQQGHEADKCMLAYVRAEVLFQKGLKEDSESCMKASIAYMKQAASYNLYARASERLRYFEYFCAQHFLDMDLHGDASACPQVMPEEEFRAQPLLERSEKKFDYNDHVSEHIFTL
jgi:hypothetical protein